jgi:hypothetical protein
MDDEDAIFEEGNDAVVFELDVDDLTDNELQALAEQAVDAIGAPLERGRLGVAFIIGLVFGIALGKRDDRRTGENRFSRGFAPIDKTAPPSHKRRTWRTH